MGVDRTQLSTTLLPIQLSLWPTHVGSTWPRWQSLREAHWRPGSPICPGALTAFGCETPLGKGGSWDQLCRVLRQGVLPAGCSSQLNCTRDKAPGESCD